MRAQITRLVSAVRDAGHSPALLTELSALETQERDLAAHLARMEGYRPEPLQVDMEDMLQATSAALESSTDPEKGIILRGFVKRIAAERNGGITGEIECYVGGSDTTVVVPL